MRLSVSEREDHLSQGNHRAFGVVLRRKEGSRGSQELLLFLKGMGARWISAPGAEGPKNRFGGGTEPLVWSLFDFYQSPRRLYLKGVGVREDFLGIHRSVKKLNTAVRWCRLLAKALPPGVECDDLLALFWGSLKNLTSEIDPLLADLRFVWRWGSLWGLSPSLESCCACGTCLQLTENEQAARCHEGLLCPRCALSRLESSAFPPISGALLQGVCCAAMLPREKFLAWAEGLPSGTTETLAGCTRWLQTFLDIQK